MIIWNSGGILCQLALYVASRVVIPDNIHATAGSLGTADIEPGGIGLDHLQWSPAACGRYCLEARPTTGILELHWPKGRPYSLFHTRGKGMAAIFGELAGCEKRSTTFQVSLHVVD